MADPTQQDPEADNALYRNTLTMKDGRKIKGKFVRFQDDSLVFREAHYEGSSEDYLTEIHAAGVTPASKSFLIPRADIIKLEQMPNNLTGPLIIAGSVVAFMWSFIFVLDNS